MMRDKRNRSTNICTEPRLISLGLLDQVGFQLIQKLLICELGVPCKMSTVCYLFTMNGMLIQTYTDVKNVNLAGIKKNDYDPFHVY